MEPTITHTNPQPDRTVVLKNLSVPLLSADVVAALSNGVLPEMLPGKNLVPQHLEINKGIFSLQRYTPGFPLVEIAQEPQQLRLSCSCGNATFKLCEHQAQVLYSIMQQPDLNVFFNAQLRQQKLREFATAYGMEAEENLEEFFQLSFAEGATVITPLYPSLLPITKETMHAFKQMLVPPKKSSPLQKKEAPHVFTRIIVFRKHKFYKHLLVELYDGLTNKDGGIKNPLTPVDVQELIWQTEHAEEIKFYTAITRFQSGVAVAKTELDFSNLRAIVKNPLQLAAYYHNSDVSEKVTAAALSGISLVSGGNTLDIVVQKRNIFYELTARFIAQQQVYELKDIELLFSFFVQAGSAFFLVKDVQTLELIQFFKRKPAPLLIHQSKYNIFKAQLLEKIELQTPVAYTYVKPASPLQLRSQGFQQEKEKIIYLSDAGLHVLLIPVMKYGEVEIPIRSKRQLLGTDEKGKEFFVNRDNNAEITFTALITRQHPDFAEQLENDLPEFYLHRRHFLDEEWFLPVFEDWQHHGIKILGFNEITNNRWNGNKAKITVQVISGINWFNTEVNVKYGKQKASLKAVHKALKDKSKFVLLDDGTQGLLPAEWIEKLFGYFNAADITEDDLLRTPKVNYSAVQQLYDEEMLSEEVKVEIHGYEAQLANLTTLEQVDVPADLQATLRPYQKQGLYWLSLLDKLNFGGCLADDMGLGKTIQIIAFILVQRSRVKQNTNLLVVPTSLIFNWQAEVEKFAPSIKILTIHGAGRVKSNQQFADYEIVLTSYGTLLSDISFIKSYVFNYIFLDESQNIKNPESQRYKAARLLQSRNKIAITGTPIENNTFDIYGQLSFACPGLLGGKKYFRDVYSTPIDKFKVSKRAAELQRKIKPFILRRTKQQVATELPDKTEMVLYCEMNPAQQNIYDAFEREFREFISAITNDEIPKKAIHVLRGLTRLRQICNSPILLKEETIKETSSAKIEMLMEQIEIKAPQHKILVFSQFVSMLELVKQELEERKIKYTWLTGSTTRREAVVNQFQDDDTIRVFLISLKAGGTGLNLTAADYVYIVDPWWNPAVENQAIDRTYRIGQHKNVIAARLICRDTVEEKILKLQEAKSIVADKLIQADASFIGSLSKDDLMGLVS